MSQLCPANADGANTLVQRLNANAIIDSIYFTTNVQAAVVPAAAPVAVPANTPSAAPAAVTVTSNFVQTVAPAELKRAIAAAAASLALKENVSTSTQQQHVFTLPLLQCLFIEIITCLHQSVVLTPLTGPFLALIVQLIMRTEAQLCVAVPTAPTPSFSNRELMIRAVVVAVPSGSSSGGSTLLSLDDLIHAMSDLVTLQIWLQSRLPALVISSCAKAHKGSEAENELFLPVSRALTLQANKCKQVIAGFWARALSIVCADCKVAVQSVKSVAGKYRMTNKPPPDSASPFVPSILQPLR